MILNISNARPKDEPDCNDQNVELNGEGVEPDRHIEYRVNFFLIVTLLSPLNHASHVVSYACVVPHAGCPDVDGVCGDVSHKPSEAIIIAITVAIIVATIIAIF